MNLLPVDIINHILEYNANHRVMLKKSLAKITTYASMRRVEYIYKIWKDDIRRRRLNEETSNFNMYLYNNIDDANLLIYNISKCNCCIRHSILRPNKLNCREYINFSRGAAPRLKEEMYCMCKCRYFCREIHNTFNLSNEFALEN